MPRPLMALFIEFLLALPCPLCYPVYKHKFHKESSVPGIHAISFYSGQLPSPQRAGSVFLSELYASSNYLQQAGKMKKTGLVRCRQHCVLRYELLLDRRRFFGFFAATEEEVLKDGTG